MLLFVVVAAAAAAASLVIAFSCAAARLSYTVQSRSQSLFVLCCQKSRKLGFIPEFHSSSRGCRKGTSLTHSNQSNLLEESSDTRGTRERERDGATRSAAPQTGERAGDDGVFVLETRQTRATTRAETTKGEETRTPRTTTTTTRKSTDRPGAAEGEGGCPCH